MGGDDLGRDDEVPSVSGGRRCSPRPLRLPTPPPLSSAHRPPLQRISARRGAAHAQCST